MSTTKVYYIVPDDGDDEAHPNLFSIPQSQNSIKLRDVKQHFPLKQHAYHFRFKKSFQNKFVWLDCIDDNSGVPSYEGVLFCKISRLGELGAAKTGQAKVTATTAASSKASVPSNNVAQTSKKQEKSNVVPDVPFVAAFDDSEKELFEWTDLPGSNPTPTNPSSAPGPAKPSAAPRAGDGENDLLDFLGSAPSSSPPPVSGMEDFEWGFPASAPAPNAAASVSMGGFPGVAPVRTTSPANNGQTQQQGTKPSSKIPTKLGAEAAKQFTL